MDNRLSLIVFVLCSVSDGLSQYVGVRNDENTFNPDGTAKIVRPCLVYDKNCIRQFFAKHADCAISKDPVPDPLYRTQTSVYLPRVNISVTFTNVQLRGLNGRIEEFYVNKETDNLVIAIDFQGLTISSNDSYFSFHRKGKEPVVTRDFASITYQSVVMTTVIPNIDNLQLDKAEVVAYSNNAVPPFIIGPNALASSDPAVQAMLTEFLADIPTNIQETFLTDAPFYPPTFIQYNICDFGLKVL